MNRSRSERTGLRVTSLTADNAFGSNAYELVHEAAGHLVSNTQGARHFEDLAVFDLPVGNLPLRANRSET